MADNLPYFKANYEYSPQTADLFLTEACLCGSRNITEYILGMLKFGYQARPDLLGYIAASMNTEWAKEVAFLLASEKIPMTDHIYRLAHGPIVEEIAAIFKTASSKAGGVSTSQTPLVFSAAASAPLGTASSATTTTTTPDENLKVIPGSTYK